MPRDYSGFNHGLFQAPFLGAEGVRHAYVTSVFRRMPWPRRIRLQSYSALPGSKDHGLQWSLLLSRHT